MSVPFYKRAKRKLDIIDKSEKFTALTISIVSNDKHFPKRFRWCLNDPIIKSCLRVNSYIHGANSIFPKAKSEMRFRNSIQLKAIEEINELLSMISVAKQSFAIDLNSIKTWLSDAIELRTILKGWYESDVKRIDKLLNE